MRALRRLSLLAVLPLAGCMGSGFAPGGGANALRELPLYNGRIVVRGPEGYCVDPTSLRRQSGGALVFLGSCEALSGQPGTRVEAALMTVTVTPRRPGTSQPTARDIAAALSPKQPLRQIDEDGIAMVHFNAGGAVTLPGGDPRYWRGGMALGGHLVSLAVYGPEGSRIAGPGGRALLQGLASEIRRASPRANPGAAPPARTAFPQRQTKPDKPGGLRGFFGGLFPNAS